MRITVAELGAGFPPKLREAAAGLGPVVEQSGLEAIEAARRGSLDLVLIWAPGEDGGAAGAALCRALAAEDRQATPVLCLAPDGGPDAYVACMEAGGDACLLGTVSPAELTATCVALVSRAERRRSASPLTGLPGNASLEREIAARLPRRGQLAVLGCDLSRFKAYNDRYGYFKGDEVVKWVGETLQTAVTAAQGPDDFVAHIGGDDFFVVTAPERAERIALAAIKRFDHGIGSFYDEDARSVGGIWSWTREGEPAFSPICSLIIAGVTNSAEDLTHPGQVAQVLAELKEYGKGFGKSIYVKDRRSDHSWRAAKSGAPGRPCESLGEAEVTRQAMPPQSSDVSILLVGCDADLAQPVSDTLGAKGYLVRAIGSADELAALLDLPGGRPDVAIVDAGLSLEHWNRCIGALRSRPETSRIPVILLTALRGPVDMADLPQLPTVWYYTKPIIDYEDFALLVAYVLGAAV